MTSRRHSNPGHNHNHGPGHIHDHGHAHVPAVTADSERRVFRVMLLTGAFTLVEAMGGLISGSLALLADAGHMLSDTAALGLAWWAFRLGRRPSDSRRSFGYHRSQILAAFINSLALFAVAGWIVWEAIQRIQTPQPVLAGPMLAVALAGLAVNVIGFLVLHRGDRHNVNLRGAMLHVMGDLLGSVAAILAAIVILWTGWTPIDPLLSVLVALLVLKSAWDIARRSGHILMEGTPEGFDPSDLRADLMATIPGLMDVHHIHAWVLTAERPIITLHVHLAADANPRAALRDLKTRLREWHGFDHSTIQLDHYDCPDEGPAGEPSEASS